VLWERKVITISKDSCGNWIIPPVLYPYLFEKLRERCGNDSLFYYQIRKEAIKKEY